MVSGRLAGMAVRPLPRQSTMPLLQVHMAGQEPEERVQDGGRPASPWPAGAGDCDLRLSRQHRGTFPRHRGNGREQGSDCLAHYRDLLGTLNWV